MVELLLAALGTLALTYLACIAVSALAGGWVQHALEIDAPIGSVWDYGSNSRAAAEWSVYFHHITPIEGPGLAPDGAAGALRVCHREPDEGGMRWDEETVASTPTSHRQIRTYDLVGFPFGAIGRAQEYEVHQEYETIGADRTLLTFRSRLVRRAGVSLLAWPVVKAMYVVFGQPAGQEVFVWNLENIKAAVEARHAGRPYVRPHAYSTCLPWEARPLRWWLANRLGALLRVRARAGAPASTGVPTTA